MWRSRARAPWRACRCSIMRPAASRCPPIHGAHNSMQRGALLVLGYAPGCVTVPPVQGPPHVHMEWFPARARPRAWLRQRCAHTWGVQMLSICGIVHSASLAPVTSPAGALQSHVVGCPCWRVTQLLLQQCWHNLYKSAAVHARRRRSSNASTRRWRPARSTQTMHGRASWALPALALPRLATAPVLAQHSRTPVMYVTSEAQVFLQFMHTSNSSVEVMLSARCRYLGVE